jgi:hypothetical protein
VRVLVFGLNCWGLALSPERVRLFFGSVFTGKFFAELLGLVCRPSLKKRASERRPGGGASDGEGSPVGPRTKASQQGRQTRDAKEGKNL